MIIRGWRMLVASSLALAVLLAYSVPLRAFPVRKSAGKLRAGTTIVQTEDDDDDRLSGGALAVLLLAIGGAVAGVLYISHPPPGVKHCSSIDVKKPDGNTIRVTNDKSSDTGKPSSNDWTSTIDQNSRIIKLLRDKTSSAGRRMHSEWAGKIDGKFYSVTGDPLLDELSLTMDGRTLAFNARKAGQVVESGNVALSADAKSFTMTTNGVTHVFSAFGNAKITNMGRAPKQAEGIGRLDLRVVDENCNPIKDVRAHLESTLADGYFCESWNTTDERGVAPLPPLHMGKLTLTLTAKGFETQKLPVNAADLDQPVRVVLHKK